MKKIKIVSCFSAIFIVLCYASVNAQYYRNNYYGNGYGYNGGYGGYNYVSPGMALRMQAGLYGSSGFMRLYNPNYVNIHMDGYMPMPSLGFYGYFIGHIEYGYPHKYGTLYYYDNTAGWVTYKGGFDLGLPHGEGEWYSSRKGYIKGLFNQGVLVQRLDVSQEEIIQSVRDSVEQSDRYSEKDKNKMTLEDIDIEVKEIDEADLISQGRQMFKRK